jgi:glucose/arabinose dehydrogenase
MFQPLGIKYHNGELFVGCRNEIVKLVDLNGDEEIDFYKSFNNDHQVSDHFHEFAMGLQVDDDNNFYYAKSARHARTALIPQHGTLIKVSPDGSNSVIIAKGFRAANGVCMNPDGSFFVTDQEGHWNPMNRINRVTDGGFYGNMYGYGAPADSTDQAMLQPLCWIDMRMDRSPSELLWANSDKWGELNGQLLNLSYGYGKIYAVYQEEVNARWNDSITYTSSANWFGKSKVSSY